MQTKVFLPWVIYMVNIETKDLVGPLYKLDVNISEEVKRKGSKFYLYFYNKKKEVWSIPQTCNQKDPEVHKEIIKYFNKLVKVKSMVLYLGHEIKTLARIENSIKKSKDNFLKKKTDYINSKRGDEIIQNHLPAYNTDWSRVKHFNDKLKNYDEQQKKSKDWFKVLESRGFKVKRQARAVSIDR